MKTNRFRARSRAFTLALATATSALLGLGSGCGSSVSGTTLCEQICTCQGCNQTESQECQAEFAKAEKLSGDQGCDDAYGTYVDCLAGNLKCVDDHVDSAACMTELTALTACAKTIPISTPGGGSCQLYKTKIQSCCDKIPDPSSQAACNQAVEQIDLASADEKACKAANDAVSCPY